MKIYIYIYIYKNDNVKAKNQVLHTLEFEQYTTSEY